MNSVIMNINFCIILLLSMALFAVVILKCINDVIKKKKIKKVLVIVIAFYIVILIMFVSWKNMNDNNLTTFSTGSNMQVAYSYDLSEGCYYNLIFQDDKILKYPETIIQEDKFYDLITSSKGTGAWVFSAISEGETVFYVQKIMIPNHICFTDKYEVKIDEELNVTYRIHKDVAIDDIFIGDDKVENYKLFNIVKVN